MRHNRIYSRLRRDPPWQPTLIYTARGTATAWEPTPEPAPDTLRRLIGPTRAAILQALQAPQTGADLARALDVTPSAVSQHFTVLRDAALVATHRAGRHVVAQRTEWGNHICPASRGTEEQAAGTELPADSGALTCALPAYSRAGLMRGGIRVPR